MTVEPTSPATVLADHLFGFGGLMLVMCRLGILIILLGLPLLPLHHPFGFAHGATGSVGGARGTEQQGQAHQKNSDSFHCFCV